jgi:hypothetical protein
MELQVSVFLCLLFHTLWFFYTLLFSKQARGWFENEKEYLNPTAAWSFNQQKVTCSGHSAWQ